jgi:hypothetical protein
MRCGQRRRTLERNSTITLRASPTRRSDGRHARRRAR